MRNFATKISAAMLIAVVTGVAASACAGDGELFGTVIGGTVGGLFGSQIGRGSGQLAATGIGVVAGGLIGNSVGRDIDNERNYSAAPYANGYEMYNEPAPVGYYYGSYTPNYVAPPAPPPIYVDQQAGTYCRQYSQDIRIDGQMRESYGTACLQPDGSWRIVQ